MSQTMAWRSHVTWSIHLDREQMTCTQRGYIDIPRYLVLKCGIRIQIIKIHCWIGERNGETVHDDTEVEGESVIWMQIN